MESAGEGSGRPAALPLISPTFVLAIASPFLPSPPLFETTGCHAGVRGTEKRTRQSRQADKPAYERMMSKVRKKKKEKGDREEGERPGRAVARRTYVPSTSEPKQKGGGRWEERLGGVGWGGVGIGWGGQRAERDRMRKERRRPDQI